MQLKNLFIPVPNINIVSQKPASITDERVTAVQIQCDQTCDDDRRRDEIGESPENVCPWSRSLAEGTPEYFSCRPKHEMRDAISQKKSENEIPD